MVSISRANDQSAGGLVCSSPLVKGPPAMISKGPSAKRAPTSTTATVAAMARTKPSTILANSFIWSDPYLVLGVRVIALPAKGNPRTRSAGAFGVSLARNSARPLGGTDSDLFLNSYTICPGFVETDMMDAFKGHADAAGVPFADFIGAAKARVPMGRFLAPEEIAHIAVYLGSAESDGMTGQAICISGGRLLAARWTLQDTGPTKR